LVVVCLGLWSHLPPPLFLRYIKGRLTLDKVTEAVNSLNDIFGEKYKVVLANPSKLREPFKTKHYDYKAMETKETQGLSYYELAHGPSLISYFLPDSSSAGFRFVVEGDIRDSKEKFKLDPAGRAVVTILRHLGRIKEVRGGGQTRYVIC